MRPSRVFLLMVVALAVSSCARQSSLRYASSNDPATHRPGVDDMIYGPAGGDVYSNPDQAQAAPAPPQTYAVSAAPTYASAAGNSADQQTYAYSGSGHGEQPYTLDAGDRVRVTVFGQDGLNMSYTVDPSGMITMPLAGMVPARGLSKDQLAAAITQKLKAGYIREPHVAVEIEACRPFFILGEVAAPGQYPYVANMTVETAVAIAGGFTPRADHRKITVSRNIGGTPYRGTLPADAPVRPGDTISVVERWF
jgi:polysaccharide export outer membrane protein